MAQYNQVVRPSFYNDETVKNTDTTTISAGHSVRIDTSTYSSAVSPLPVLNIIYSSDVAKDFYGIAVEDIPPSGIGRVCTFGYAVGIAGTGGITANDIVKMDVTDATNAGRLLTVTIGTATTGTRSIGMAKHTAAIGEYALVFITQAPVTSA